MDNLVPKDPDNYELDRQRWLDKLEEFRLERVNGPRGDSGILTRAQLYDPDLRRLQRAYLRHQQAWE